MAYRRLQEDYDEFAETGDSDGDIREENTFLQSNLQNQPMFIPVSNELIEQPTQFSGQRNIFQVNNSPNVYPVSPDTSSPFESDPPPRLMAVRSQGTLAQGRSTSALPSVSLPQLKDFEQMFFKLVSQGRTESVEKFLDKRENFNINCTTFEGQTALHIAMEARNEEMVKTLLKRKELDVTDCALHAIRLDQPNILVNILDRLKDISPDLEFSGCVYSADFSVNMTPLIIAAQYGNYDIIGILQDRGHHIPRPHGPCCLCKAECLRIIKTEDTFLMINALLDVYRAIGNPAYICHTSKDPILYAFELSVELQKCAAVYSVFKEDFLKIAYNVKLFAADLVGCCRSCEEVNTVLSQTEGLSLQGNLMFPRLILAMNLKQKEFVADSGVQQVLEAAMIGTWYEFRCISRLQKLLLTIPRMFLLPFVVVVTILLPASEYAKYYSYPINRLINHTSSYIIFLILLYMQSTIDKTDQRKKMDLSGYEIPIALFVIGRSVKIVKLCIIQGTRQYLRSQWHKYSVAMELLFALYFTFFLVAYIQVMKLSEDQQELERKYWHYLDPQLVAEALFTIATIMSYIKLLSYIQVLPDIGPLQVALGKMVFDIFRYTILFLIVLMAFNAGLCKLYSYYSGMSRIDPDTQAITRQEDVFTNSIDTLKYLFWGMFAVSDPDSANIVIENLAGDEGKTILNEHYLTEAVGYYAFAIYMVLTVIIILNMMIGTMANTYQKVVDNVQVEWVYGRTEIFLVYTQESILPPPFNLLPVPIGYAGCSDCVQKNSFGLLNARKKSKAIPDVNGDEEYSKLMVLLAQRYFQRKTEDQPKKPEPLNVYF